jgi:hypothetical protein
LRRSPRLRSLIFPHGLLPFSARMRSDIQFAAHATALATPHTTSACHPQTLQLGLFLLVFWISEGCLGRPFQAQDRIFVAAAKDGMMMLIFAASLTRRFRIVMIVTNLQQDTTAGRRGWLL